MATWTPVSDTRNDAGRPARTSNANVKEPVRPDARHGAAVARPPSAGPRVGPAAVALTLLIIIAACSLALPLVVPHGPNEFDFSATLLAPAPNHPWGTDDLGRDVFARVLAGGRVSLAVGLMAVLLALAAGLLVGGVAGYRGGMFDYVVMRIVDAFLSIPMMLIILLLSSVIEPGLFGLGVLIAGTQWMEAARVVRSVVLTRKGDEFVEAARALGLSERYILFRHVLVHAIGPLAALSTILFAQAIMLESAVSFLGYGVQPPAVSWGGMLESARGTLDAGPWLAFFPGVMIFMTVLCCYTIGDYLHARLVSPSH